MKNQRADRRKFHYIYRITNTLNKKFYIGMHSTDNLDDGYFGSGKLLWFSIRKHGKENHMKEILEFLPDRKALAAREKEIVNATLLEDDQCMNLQIGGGCDDTSVFNNALERNGFFGKKHSEKSKMKISKSGTGKIRKSETKQKISSALKGKPLSVEHREKLRLSNIGKKQNKSEEALKNIEAAKCRAITLDGVNYSSIKEASMHLNVSRSRIYKLLKMEVRG